MSNEITFLIKKLGGENAAELDGSSKNIFNDYNKGIKQAVIVSAIRGPDFNTTDNLIQIGNLLAQKDINKEKVIDLLKKLEKFHIEILDKKIKCNKVEIEKLIKKEFLNLTKDIEYYIKSNSKTIIPSSLNDYSINIGTDKILPIIGFGETLSCKIYSEVINTISGNGLCAKSVDLSNLVEVWELKGKNDREIFDLLSSKIANIVTNNIKKGIIPILSGYIGIFENGIENAIGRGYSDATAAITSVGLARQGNNVILEIQKSVKGLLSADPKILDNPKEAKLIKNLNYLTAREITGDNGAQAKLLHYQTLRSEVQEAGIKIHLYDPFSTESNGSWIDDNQHECDLDTSVEFVGGRKNIIFFTISSGKMFEKGILTRLFSIVDDYFSVDIVSTSETEVTFTIDGKNCNDKILNEMTKKIKDEFSMENNNFMEFVEYKKNKSLVFCVGQHMKDRIGVLSKATKALSENGVNIEIISQGLIQRAIVFGINENDMKKSINALHKAFIVNN